MYYRVSLEGYQTICVGSFHLQRANKLYRKYKPVRITQKEHLLIWNSETTQNLDIYHYNYQTETISRVETTTVKFLTETFIGLSKILSLFHKGHLGHKWILTGNTA